MKSYQIYKAAGIIIQDGKHLLERSKGKKYFIEPGGSIEKEETPKQALVRELKEELNIDVQEEDLAPFGTFYADAAGQEHLIVRMDVFMVSKWQGQIKPGAEVEELAWIGKEVPPGMKVGSIFEHEIHPRLKREGLID